MAKQKDNRHLKEFIQAGAILREIEYDRIILDDKPDIIIEVDGKKIGLEMTECHASTILSNMKISRQKAINRVNVICKKYKERLKSQGVQDVTFYIGFSFKLYEVLSKKRYDSKIVQEVLDAIDVHRNENELRLQGGEAYKQWLREHRHNRAHLKYVDSVKFYNVEGTLEVNQVIATLSTTIEYPRFGMRKMYLTSPPLRAKEVSIPLIIALQSSPLYITLTSSPTLNFISFPPSSFPRGRGQGLLHHLIIALLWQRHRNYQETTS